MQLGRKREREREKEKERERKRERDFYDFNERVLDPPVYHFQL